MAMDRLLVVCPTWLGDAVMATPTLRALRGLYPRARITALVRQNLRPILDGCPWIDRFVTVRPRRKGRSNHRRGGLFDLARRLSLGRFDAAVILPNSFRTALIVRMAGIPRRIGYDRDGRGGLLTDRMIARKSAGRFVPVPTRDYYLGIARYLGAIDPDPRMELTTRPADDARAGQLLAAAGFTPDRPLVVLNPGAGYGPAKMWPAERFAQVADRLHTEHHAQVAVSGAPNERAILDRVIASARSRLIDLPAAGIDLRLLKSVLRRASLLITNDTGPRHVAAALDVPVVTIFGPTDPAWTLIAEHVERHVRVEVYCGPCQKKDCPLRHTPEDHQCMKLIDAGMVTGHAAALLTVRATPVHAASAPRAD